MTSTPISIDELSAKIAQQTAEFDAKHTPASLSKEQEPPDSRDANTSPAKNETLEKETTTQSSSTPGSVLPPPLLSSTQACLLLRTLFLVFSGLCAALCYTPAQQIHYDDNLDNSRTVLLQSLEQTNQYEVIIFISHFYISQVSRPAAVYRCLSPFFTNSFLCAILCRVLVLVLWRRLASVLKLKLQPSRGLVATILSWLTTSSSGIFITWLQILC